MEIILKEDIANLGYKNDIVKVKSGYGRNYLIPSGKAVIASPSARKSLAEELKQRAHKLEKIKKDAEAIADSLKDVALTIATKVSSTGTIFGSVSNIQIADELEKLGHKIDRKLITVAPVKEVGNYVATVKLHKEVVVEIPFKVIAEGTEEEAPKAE
ncbi:50S ribosomal protein L9 [Phocaeicola oris]|uniref:50S ribosomal protein L9 n=1 Tax=Phocaeicola oris TaxID=2896850 RepID=UPI00234E7BD3|nr:50S ribosomal protein L9 [Phocaeicola oris]MCE2616195.1 50S ribosomal protein L9 [Phocaeicola oris]